MVMFDCFPSVIVAIAILASEEQSHGTTLGKRVKKSQILFCVVGHIFPVWWVACPRDAMHATPDQMHINDKTFEVQQKTDRH